MTKTNISAQLQLLKEAQLPAQVWHDKKAGETHGVPDFRDSVPDLLEKAKDTPTTIYVRAGSYTQASYATGAMGKVLALKQEKVRWVPWDIYVSAVQMFERGGFMEPESESFKLVNGYHGGWLIIPDMFYPMTGTNSRSVQHDIEKPERDAAARILKHLRDGGSLILGGKETVPTLHANPKVYAVSSEFMDTVFFDFTIVEARKG